MACNKHSMSQVYKILSDYQGSEHWFEKGEKKKKFNLRFICCVDTKYGNINSLTDEWFLGEDGFFFKGSKIFTVFRSNGLDIYFFHVTL